MLLDPARTRSVAEIATAVGIPNPAVFSRNFRARYGHSPRDLRPPVKSLASALSAVGRPLNHSSTAKPPQLTGNDRTSSD